MGYNLRIQLSEESDPQLLEDTIKRHVKKYWVYSFVHHHEYTLPYDEMKSFPYLFGALEGMFATVLQSLLGFLSVVVVNQCIANISDCMVLLK